MLSRNRIGTSAFVVALLATGAAAQLVVDQTTAAIGDRNPGLEVGLAGVVNMPVRLRPSGAPGLPYAPRDNCPQTTSLTTANFSGGTYVAQGGFAEGEIAAQSYTLPGNLFPLKITLMEFIIAQQNAVVQTTTEWSVLIWDGTPNSPQPPGFPIEYSSDGTILPHVIMGPGTRGTNVQVSVDPADPEQIFIFNTNNQPTHTFSIGFRIDRHNAQSANPCFTAPPADRNAFPTTDNTVIGCGTGYGALNFPSDNWLFALNCGANGCPPNGGWTRFSGLQADQSFFGICLTGCRPRGDWIMRVSWDPVNCPPPDGACCFGTAGCVTLSQSACQGSGGTWRGPGSTCGTNTGGTWSGCVTPPNAPPVAQAGADQTVTDSNGNGSEVVVVDGSASTDSDGFIAAYRWSEGATVLQDGPAFFSGPLSIGQHVLTLRVTDDDGAFSEDTVTITVNPGGCVADTDDGSGSGTPDGGVGIEDLLYYLSVYDAGVARADVDDGSGTGTPDGGVGIEDLLYFLGRYDLGC